MLVLSQNEDLLKKDSTLSLWGSSSHGLGWAIFGKDGKLEGVGVVSPFAAGASEVLNRDEIYTKMCRVWEERKGYHARPKILCLEAARNVSNGKSTYDRDFLNGMFRAHFDPKIMVAPTTEEKELELCRFFDKRTLFEEIGGHSCNVLKNTLVYISKLLHHLIYKAVGLGFFAIQEQECSAKPTAEEDLLAA